MWHDGDYRILVRYERRPKEPDRQKLWVNKVFRAMEDTYAGGCGDMRSLMSERSMREVATITVVVLQKRIKEDGLKAWATLGIGRSFCQARDQFDKNVGRRIAFGRAIKRLNSKYRYKFCNMAVAGNFVIHSFG